MIREKTDLTTKEYVQKWFIEYLLNGKFDQQIKDARDKLDSFILQIEIDKDFIKTIPKETIYANII